MPGSLRRPVRVPGGPHPQLRATSTTSPPRWPGRDETGRDVYCLDYRGRGRSQHDPDWKNYSILVELNDALDFMAMKGLDRAAVVGTSRGGLIAMLMGVLRPGAMGAVVLNDIGPVIEREGLARIVAYVGRVPLPADWKEATELVYEMNRRQFTAVPAEQWERRRPPAVQRRQRPARSRPTTPSSPRRSRSWTGRRPSCGRSSPRSRARAGAGHPRRELRHPERQDAGRDAAPAIPGSPPSRVRGQGHAPLLRDAPTIGAIAGFLARTDGEAYAPLRSVA